MLLQNPSDTKFNFTIGSTSTEDMSKERNEAELTLLIVLIIQISYIYREMVSATLELILEGSPNFLVLKHKHIYN